MQKRSKIKTREMTKGNGTRLPAVLQLLATFVLAAVTLSVGAGVTYATSIETNKSAYAVGESVTIRGEGWQPQEVITLIASNSAGTRSSSMELVAGPDGSFRSDSYIVKDLDRDQLVTLIARGESGAETMLAFRAGIAPGTLKCSALPSGSSNYGIPAGKTVTCTIEGASDLSPAQQAGLQPVEVLVKGGPIGTQRVPVTSVSGGTISFTWTPTSNACGSTTVSYGPIQACDRTSRTCATLPAEGNEANNVTVSGGIGGSAAGFTIVDGSGNPTSCGIPQLQVATYQKNGAFSAESQASYTVVVTNPQTQQGSTATNVQLAGQLPGNGGLVWESATASKGTCVAPVLGNMLQCNLGDLPPQDSVTVTVTTTAATPAAACQYQPVPAVMASADGGVTASDSGFLTCTPLAPGQLKVVVAPKSSTFNPGAQVTYRILVANPAPIGSAPVRNVQLKDQLPGNGGLKWNSVSTNVGNCSVVDNFLSCSFGDLLALRSAIVVVESTATTSLEACQDQPNVDVAASADGGLTAQDSGFVTCTTGGPPQLSVASSPRTLVFTPGSKLTVTSVVSNVAPAGSAAARNVVLRGQLPGNGGLTWTSVNVSQGGCFLESNDLNCSLGTLNPGASATVVVSTPTTTPAPACTWQPTNAATAMADGGYRAVAEANFACGHQTCIPSGTSIGNVSWNKFDVPTTSAVVWVNAHLGKVSGIPARPAQPVTMLFTGGSLKLDNGLSIPLPDGSVTFDPKAGDAATTFIGNRWETVVNPQVIGDEVFLSGAAIRLDKTIAESIASGAKATISFASVYADVEASFNWQWSAATYTYWPADMNEAAIEPVHSGLHAGAPRNRDVQKSLIQGPRGGAGSNFTGSWSSTGNGSSQCSYSDDSPD